MIMLAEAEKRVSEKGFGVGLCFLIYFVIMEMESGFHVFRHKTLKGLFPELFAKMPKGKRECDSWFDYGPSGWQSRISLLKQCITETEDAWPK